MDYRLRWRSKHGCLFHCISLSLCLCLCHCLFLGQVFSTDNGGAVSMALSVIDTVIVFVSVFVFVLVFVIVFFLARSSQRTTVVQ